MVVANFTDMESESESSEDEQQQGSPLPPGQFLRFDAKPRSLPSQKMQRLAHHRAKRFLSNSNSKASPGKISSKTTISRKRKKRKEIISSLISLRAKFSAGEDKSSEEGETSSQFTKEASLARQSSPGDLSSNNLVPVGEAAAGDAPLKKKAQKTSICVPPRTTSASTETASISKSNNNANHLPLSQKRNEGEQHQESQQILPLYSAILAPGEETGGGKEAGGHKNIAGVQKSGSKEHECSLEKNATTTETATFSQRTCEDSESKAREYSPEDLSANSPEEATGGGSPLKEKSQEPSICIPTTTKSAETKTIATAKTNANAHALPLVEKKNDKGDIATTSSAESAMISTTSNKTNDLPLTHQRNEMEEDKRQWEAAGGGTPLHERGQEASICIATPTASPETALTSTTNNSTNAVRMPSNDLPLTHERNKMEAGQDQKSPQILPLYRGDTAMNCDPNGARRLSKSFQVGKYDVLCARGKKAHESEGNRRFRALVKLHQTKYAACTCRGEKAKVVRHIVNTVRNASPNGGFVKIVDGEYWEAGDLAAREKVSQAFRDLLHSKYSSSVKAKARARIEKREQQQRQQPLVFPQLNMNMQQYLAQLPSRVIEYASQDLRKGQPELEQTVVQQQRRESKEKLPEELIDLTLRQEFQRASACNVRAEKAGDCGKPDLGMTCIMAPNDTDVLFANGGFDLAHPGNENRDQEYVKDMNFVAATNEDHHTRIKKKLKYGDRGCRIFDLLLEHGSLNRKELALIIGVVSGTHSFSYGLKELKDKAYVEVDSSRSSWGDQKLRLTDKAFLPGQRPASERTDPKVLAKLIGDAEKAKTAKKEGSAKKKTKPMAHPHNIYYNPVAMHQPPPRAPPTYWAAQQKCPPPPPRPFHRPQGQQNTDPVWEQFYACLIALHNHYGSSVFQTLAESDINMVQDTHDLVEWLSHQRKLYRLEKLEPNKVCALERLGMDWSLPIQDCDWDWYCKHVKAHFARHGTLKSLAGGSHVFEWLMVQRRAYMENNLVWEQREKLEQAGLLQL